MDFEHFRAVELAASQESAINRLQSDLDRAIDLLDAHGVVFRRTPDPTMPWYDPNKDRDAGRPGAVQARPGAYPADDLSWLEPEAAAALRGSQEPSGGMQRTKADARFSEAFIRLSGSITSEAAVWDALVDDRGGDHDGDTGC